MCPGHQKANILSGINKKAGIQKLPQSIAYRMTPHDQRSTLRPTYFLPAIISGAA